MGLFQLPSPKLRLMALVDTLWLHQGRIRTEESYILIGEVVSFPPSYNTPANRMIRSLGQHLNYSQARPEYTIS